MLGVVCAVKSGVGIAPRPTALGDAESDLIQVLGPVPELAKGWYVLTHSDLRYTPKISAFVGFVIEELALLRPILTG